MARDLLQRGGRLHPDGPVTMPAFKCDCFQSGIACGAVASRFYSPPRPTFRARCEDHPLDLKSMSAWKEISFEEAVVLSVMTR
jgi:hypothetical protein